VRLRVKTFQTWAAPDAASCAKPFLIGTGRAGYFLAFRRGVFLR